jgi:hypothetical protein
MFWQARVQAYLRKWGNIFLAVLAVPGMEELPSSIRAFSSSPGACHMHNFTTKQTWTAKNTSSLGFVLKSYQQAQTGLVNSKFY